jgi:hypothetical protein
MRKVEDWLRSSRKPCGPVDEGAAEVDDGVVIGTIKRDADATNGGR